MRFRKFVVVFSFFIILIGTSGIVHAESPVAPDRVWIRFESGFYSSLLKMPLGPIACPTGNSKIDELMKKYDVKQLEPVYIHDPVSLADPTFQQLGMEREYRFIIPMSAGWTDPYKLSEEFKSLSIIEDAAPIYRRDIDYTPNDWSLSGMNSWGIDTCHARQAWNVQRGDSTVLAVTIDTGVNYNHPDLWPNIMVNPLEDVNHDGRFTTADNNGNDADGNGFIDDVIGWNFVSHSYTEISGGLAATGEQYSTRNNNPMDVMGHGTHVCGSIAASTNNGVGVAAASYNVKTICVRAGFGWVDNTNALYGSGFDDDFEAAIQYAILRGARIISISFGGTGSDAAYQTAITYARSHNCLVLAAAGNNNTSTMSYPGAYTGVMAVAALDVGNVRASFSNYGTWVDISAPGVNIWSTMANNVYHATDYAAWSGTSMATPTAASVAALVLSRHPTMTSDTLEAVLRRTATNINAQNSGYIGQLGVGLINADSAVRSVAGPPVLITSPNGGESWQIGTTNTIYWSTSGSIANVKIELNRSYPSATWETIVASTPNTWTYNWTVTGAVTTTARIRVLNAANLSVGDTSSANFTIATVPPAPTSLAEYFEGTFPPTAWRNAGIWSSHTYSGNSSAELDYYDVNNVGSHDSLFTPLLNFTGELVSNLTFNTSYALYTGYYDSLIVLGRYNSGAWTSLWRQGGATLANRTGEEATAWRQNLITLTSAYQTTGVQFAFVGYNGYGDNIFLDSVQVNFSAPTFQVTSPNGGENWIIGTAHNVTWTTNMVGGNVGLQLNRTYPGGPWETLIGSTTNDGTQSWAIGGAASTTARIRVYNAANSAQGDTSNANFALTTPVISGIQRPNGGEVLRVGLVDTIRWTTNAASSLVRIILNRNYPSGSWDTLFASTANTGSILWTPTAPRSSNARVRIEFANGVGTSATSANLFRIIQPSITFLSHTVADTDWVGDNDTLRWTTTDLSTTVLLSENSNYPGVNLNSIGSAVPVSTNMYVWQVTGGSNPTRFRLISSEFSNVVDTTNANTAVLTRTLTLIHPNGGEQLTIGNQDTIRWFSNHKASIAIAYDLADMNPDSLQILPGADSISIQPGNGSFVWTPMYPPTTTARIFIGDFTDYSQHWSNATFTVSSGIPQSPRTLLITKSGNDIQLQWSRVDSTIYNQPVAITGYKVYSKADYLATPSLLSVVPGVGNTSYLHVNGLVNLQEVYYVTVYAGSSSSDSWDAIRQRPLGLGIKLKRILSVRPVNTTK